MAVSFSAVFVLVEEAEEEKEEMKYGGRYMRLDRYRNKPSLLFVRHMSPFSRPQNGVAYNTWRAPFVQS